MRPYQRNAPSTPPAGIQYRMPHSPLSRARVALGIAIECLQTRKTKKRRDAFWTTVRHELWETSKAIGPAARPSAAFAVLNPREPREVSLAVDAREPSSALGLSSIVASADRLKARLADPTRKAARNYQWRECTRMSEALWHISLSGGSASHASGALYLASAWRTSVRPIIS